MCIFYLILIFHQAFSSPKEFHKVMQMDSSDRPAGEQQPSVDEVAAALKAATRVSSFSRKAGAFRKR